MIEVGVLKNFDVDVIIGLYLWNNFFLGILGVCSGVFMVVSERFNCIILGKGGYGVMLY